MKVMLGRVAVLVGIVLGTTPVLAQPAEGATNTVHFTFEVEQAGGRVVGNADWLSATSVRFNDVWVYDYCGAGGQDDGA